MLVALAYISDLSLVRGVRVMISALTRHPSSPFKGIITRLFRPYVAKEADTFDTWLLQGYAVFIVAWV